MAENQGSWFQGASHTARDDRYTLESLIDGLGVKYDTDLLCSPQGGNLKTVVAAGHAFMIHLSPYSGIYHGYNDANVVLTHDTADGTDRKDTIVAEVVDALYDGGVSNLWRLRIVKGTTGAYPSPAALPSNAIPLAYVRVPGGATALVSGNYEDRRWKYTSHGGVTICTSTSRPGDAGWNPYSTAFTGMKIYETDTKKTLTYYGATLGWRPSDWGTAWGEIGYAQSTGSPGSGTTLADLSGLSVAVSVPAGRKLLVTGHCPIRIDGLNDRVTGWIREGSTKHGAFGDFRGGVADQTFMYHGSARINSPSSGSHTYKLSAERVGGTAGVWNASVGVSSDEPAYIMVEDIGPA